MNLTRTTLLTGLTIAALGLSAAASAHDRHDHRHWKHGHPHHHKHWHGRHHDRYYERHVVRPYYAPPYVVRERIVVQRPIYAAPPPHYYVPAYPPGVVVRVDIPPIVIPLR